MQKTNKKLNEVLESSFYAQLIHNLFKMAAITNYLSVYKTFSTVFPPYKLTHPLLKDSKNEEKRMKEKRGI